MKADLNDLKKLTLELLKNNDSQQVQENNKSLINKIYGQADNEYDSNIPALPSTSSSLSGANDYNRRDNQDDDDSQYLIAETIEDETDETLRLDQKEIELIKKALARNNGKRKAAADELGISERTLYRKIKQYDL